MLRKRLISAALAAVMALGLASCADGGSTPVLTDITRIKTNQAPLVAVYDKPASDWEQEAMPMGNGFIGAMIFGGVDSDRIQINEHTLWSGGPGADESYDGGMGHTTQDENYKNLMAAREGLQQLANDFSKNSAARKKNGEVIANEYPSSAEVNSHIDALKGDKSLYGHYQSLGNIELVDRSKAGEASDYRRTLNIDDSVAAVEYKKNGVGYNREYFVSSPGNFMAIRITCDTPGGISQLIRFTTPQSRSKTEYKDNMILFTGRPSDHKENIEHLEFAGAAKVVSDGSIKTSSGGIEVDGASEVLILFTAGTNYLQCMDSSFDYFSDEIPLDSCLERLEEVSKKSYDELKSAHIEDYHSLYSRVKLNIGADEAPTRTTDSLLRGYKYDILTPQEQRYFEALYYQFGRYLLIASSREGSLPANLQGIWADGLTPPWDADYHTNINIQMNYWLAETTNLTECHMPIVDYINSLVERGKITAKLYHCTSEGEPVRGWTTYHENNIWGNTGPAVSSAFYFPAGAAWMCQDIWEIYAFTLDKDYLSANFDTLLQASLFWVDNLVTDTRDGSLVSSPSYSPEHGPYTLGASCDQEIIWELFDFTLKAAQVLGISGGEIDEIKAAKEKLWLPKIGLDGEYLEWKDETIMDITGDYGHRHVNHLFSVHPGTLVVAGRSRQDDKIVESMKKVLNTRGDGGTGWSKAWKINFWARLRDGNHAGVMVSQILKESTYQNLFDTHPPFQIDGNFGATAGMTEMLLQSQGDSIDLLPALPDIWANGSVSGLRARGNVDVSMKWSASSLEQAELTAHSALESLSVSYSGIASAAVVDSQGRAVKLSKDGKDKISFKADEGETYIIVFENQK